MQLGVIGLGTMGANLARNAARNGVCVAIYNRTKDKTDAFMKNFKSEGEFIACHSLDALVKVLKPTRPILIMIKAGEPVDAVIHELTPLLQKGDIIIDAGNSHYKDTERRTLETSAHGLRFIGMGVSGGEKGALDGPSIMPGGDESAYKELNPLFMKMAADDGDGGKCVAYIGPGAAGHFVKMVHNGIEYALMQLIAESYDLLKFEGNKSNAELAEIFGDWNRGEDLQSYLMEITAKILTKKDEMTGGDLIDVIKDSAGQKGTGKWTTEAALTFGVPIPTINAAVDARVLSGSVTLRDRGIKLLPESIEQAYPKPEKLVSRVRIALELSSMWAYQQGFYLMEKASTTEGWHLKLSEIARIWRGGCIIRSAFLAKLEHLYRDEKKVKQYILERLAGERQLDWRRTIAIGMGRGIPLPAMTASLCYYDALRRESLPQNLIQAQRDFFGAHGFQRVDRDGMFHLQWEE